MSFVHCSVTLGYCLFICHQSLVLDSFDGEYFLSVYIIKHYLPIHYRVLVLDS